MATWHSAVTRPRAWRLGGLTVTANLSFRVGIASMTVGREEIRRAWHRHVTVGAYYMRAVRRLEQEATMPAPRDRLADVALQYGKLAEGAEAGYHDPE
jgi:hypothetical protein